jgi:hypothetical protein
MLFWAILLSLAVTLIGTERLKVSVTTWLTIFCCVMASFYLGGATQEFLDSREKEKARERKESN